MYRLRLETGGNYTSRPMAKVPTVEDIEHMAMLYAQRVYDYESVEVDVIWRIVDLCSGKVVQSGVANVGWE